MSDSSLAVVQCIGFCTKKARLRRNRVKRYPLHSTDSALLYTEIDSSGDTHCTSTSETIRSNVPFGRLAQRSEGCKPYLACMLNETSSVRSVGVSFCSSRLCAILDTVELFSFALFAYVLLLSTL
jgi:hypothetical protein